MAPTSRLRFVRGQVAWMLGVTLLLTLVDALTLRLFLTGTLVGLFLVAELTTPVNVNPAWRSRLRLLVALGLVVFGGLLVEHLLDVLPSGVV